MTLCYLYGLCQAIVIVVLAILVFVLIKYRASKQSEDYEPPHIEGSLLVEAICIGIPSYYRHFPFYCFC